MVDGDPSTDTVATRTHLLVNRRRLLCHKPNLVIQPDPSFEIDDMGMVLLAMPQNRFPDVFHPLGEEEHLLSSCAVVVRSFDLVEQAVQGRYSLVIRILAAPIPARYW